MVVSRGDVWLCKLDPVVGSEQGEVRPVVVVSHDGINLHAPTVIVVPLTSRVGKRALPTHVLLPRSESGLRKDSLVLAEQVRTVSKERLGRRLGSIPAHLMRDVNAALIGAQDLE